MDRMQLLFLLACYKQRATYSAVAGYLGVEPRSLMADLPRRPANSWVVNAKTGMPTGYRVPDLDPALLDSDRVIVSAAELSEWVQTHQPSGDPMSNVSVHGNTVAIGGFRLSIQRTLRLPNDGKTYPLPPSLGTFPVKRVDDYRDRVPASWLEHGGVFFPMWQREAAWLSFVIADPYDPVAVKVAAGKVCAVTGKPWEDGLSASPQNYMVVGTNRSQPWLDGFKTAAGEVSQFVAMPLGMGYTVEKQITGKEDVGGLQIAVHRCKPERRPARPAPSPLRSMNLDGYGSLGGQVFGSSMRGATKGGAISCSVGSAGPARAAESYDKMEACARVSEGAEMGLAAGGKMTQEIYPDTLGVDAWVPTPEGRVFVHIVNSQMWRAITGEAAPATPITARDYTSRGWPWYEIWAKEDVAVQPALAGVKNVAQIDAEKGISKQQDDTSVEVPKSQVKTIADPNAVRDGKW